MTQLRVDQVFEEVVHVGAPKLRVDQVFLEVVHYGTDPPARRHRVVIVS